MNTKEIINQNSITFPQHIEEYIKAGDAHYARQNYADAISAYSLAFKECPQCEAAGNGLVNSMMSTGRVEDAIKICIEMAAANPSSPQPYLMLGRIYYNSYSDYPKSLEAYHKALSLAPVDNNIMRYIAGIYHSANDLENAASYFSRAIEKAPDDLDAYNGLARVYMTAKDHESALGAFDKAIAAMPASAAAYCYKGGIYFEIGNKVEAENHYRKAIEIDGNYAIAYNKLGVLKAESPVNFKKPHHRTYANRIHLDEAIYYYEKAVEVNPQFEMPYFNLCLAYFDISCHYEALYNIKNFIEFKPYDSLAWYYRSVIEERLGRLNESIFSNNSALKIAGSGYDTSTEPRVYEWANSHARELSNLYYEKTPMLNKYGKDLTKTAADMKMDRYIGRRSELNQLIQILTGKNKNDALIIGEPGVGKTALVNALALSAVSAGINHPLEGFRIIEINLASLFEDNPGPVNLNALLKEAENTPGIILYIDEMHKIINYSDIFKPAVESAGARFVTTTTIEGYQKLEAIDSTLERKFEKINLAEPSKEETIEMLNGLKEDFEKFHRVKISDDAIESAVELSTKFISERKLPDKAIDAVDKACSGARVWPKAQNPHNFSNAQAEGTGNKLQQDNIITVTAEDIAFVISNKTSIPLEIIAGNLKQNRQTRIGELRKYLKSVIFGQDDAIDTIADRMIMSYSGLSNKRGPMNVFLFIGTSGVGKTEMARQLAIFLFGSENLILRLGAAGFEDVNFLAKLNTHPHSIVLFDEMDKADPYFVDSFLKIFDEGYIIQPSGKMIDVSNTIFIMTSNLLPEKHITIGSSARHDKMAVDDLKGYYRPEFLNRIDEIIVFNRLGENEVVKILDLLIAELNASILKQYEVELIFDASAIKAICREGFSETYGARELRRDFEKMVKVPLGELILKREISQSRRWLVTLDKTGEIAIISGNV